MKKIITAAIVTTIASGALIAQKIKKDVNKIQQLQEVIARNTVKQQLSDDLCNLNFEW